MISIPGYSNLRLVDQNVHNMVYRARQDSTGEPAVLRQLRPDAATPEIIHGVQREYELLQSLDSPGIVKALELIHEDGLPVLVLEDMGGINLFDSAIDLTTTEVVSIGIALTQVLDYLHARHIVHQDISPANIIYNPESRELRLIDFGIARQTLEGEVNFVNVGVEGTLPYISPEQTGRTNRSIDYRTDFYGLGSTLYHLATGQAPFDRGDQLEQMYRLIAERPTAAKQVKPSLPGALSNIIAKLLEKMPENRYQSTLAIERDLSRCQELMSEANEDFSAINFEVALDDISEQLSIPERLLSRQEELKVLHRAIEKAIDGENQVLACIGEMGTGKTALVHEAGQQIVTNHGHLIESKSSPPRADVPYASIAGAMKNLVRQLLAEPDDEELRLRLQTQLKGHENVLMKLAPDLKYLLNVEPGDFTESGEPMEARTKLAQASAALIRTMTGEKQLVVLFFDNLQWADHPSLALIESLVLEFNEPYLITVLAWRNSELSKDALRRSTILRIAGGAPDVQTLRLKNIERPDLCELLSETLRRGTEEVRELAETLYQKTEGNPLNVREFLKELYRKDLLRFDREHREWSWDESEVAALPPSENVGEHLSRKIQQTTPAVSRLLQIASCIGDDFDLDTLQQVCSDLSAEAAVTASEAVREGFLVVLTKRESTIYRFAHERIQQAAYSLFDAAERSQIHANIGQVYLSRDQGVSDDDIFEIVSQLNNSLDTPESGDLDRSRLADLNIKAGRKASESGAFQAAFKYFKTAIALFGQDVWDQYELSLSMHLEAAETAYLCGDMVQLEPITQQILTHAKSDLDRSAVLEIKLKALIASNELGETRKLGREILASLGLKLPRRTRAFHVAGLIVSLLAQTATLNDNSMANAGKMVDPEKLAVMRVLMTMCQAAYVNGNPEIAIYILKMTQLSLKHGMAPESSFAYGMFGALLIAYLGTITSGYRYGLLASSTLDSLSRSQYCKTVTLVNDFIFPWKRHLRETLDPLKAAQEAGFASGEVEFAIIAAVTSSASAFLLGHDLGTVEKNLDAQVQQANQYNQTQMLAMASVFQQAVINLQKTQQEPWKLSGAVFDEDVILSLREARADESSIANLYILKTYLAVVFNRCDLALEFAHEARSRIQSVVSSPAVGFLVLYETLAMIDRVHAATPVSRLGLWHRIRRNRRQLLKWSRHAPMNFIHGYHLVEAEIARVNGKTLEAIDKYNLAIMKARENGYLKEEAQANELAARFYLEREQTELALHFLDRTHGLYTRWGAMAKVDQLEVAHPGLARAALAHQRNHSPDTVQPGIGSFSNFLDLNTVLKAAQVLSGEVILQNLLRELMTVALENAGAHKAALILVHDQSMTVEIATTLIQGQERHQFEQRDISDSDDVPVSVVQYVARTQENLVLDDPRHEDIFTQDEYIQNVRPRSILCVPILTKSRLIGVLYLENQQSTSAFNPDRVAVLKLLASQSAIAIENARLYQQLNESKDKYVSLYENAIEGIYELDMDGNFTSINPAAARIMGYGSPEQFLSQVHRLSAEYWVDPSQYTFFREEISSKGRVLGLEARIRRQDGEETWVSQSAQTIRNEEGKAAHIEGSIIDISERKRREAAEQATTIAEASAETKSQFLANMSHEIRTPMNAIIGYTNLTLDTTLDDEQQKYLGTIKKSSGHLLRVVNDILDISKIESGKLELQKARFNLDDLFQEVQTLFTLEAQEKGISLKLPEREALGRWFTGDPVRIGQILFNLVSNAIKFTKAGQIQIRVETQLRENNTWSLDFVVTDTGMGMGEHELNTIFDSFTQGNIKPADGGTGLGLSICRSLAQMMGGEIHATSDVGEGSSFYFSVVVDPETAPQPEKRADGPAFPSRRQSDTPLLLVEDNQINQDLARSVLQKAGYTVVVANNGKEALDQLGDQDFKAVLMDIRMPVMDGFEAISQLRDLPGGDRMPVIAVSAGVLEDERRAAMEASFDAYITKPIDFDELFTLLEHLNPPSRRASEQPVDADRRQERRRDRRRTRTSERMEASTTDIVRDGSTHTQEDIYLIRGINFSRPLRNNQYDFELVSSLLGDFVEYYQDADVELQSFLDKNAIEDASRLVHNMAGVSGSFGASQLMTVSRAIEQAIKTDELVELAELDDLVTEFSRELNNYVVAINEFLEVFPQTSSTRANT